MPLINGTLDRNLVSELSAGFVYVLFPSIRQQLLNEGLALLLLIAAAAGDPLGEGVERLLICHGWACARRFSLPPEGHRRDLPILNKPPIARCGRSGRGSCSDSKRSGQSCAFGKKGVQ